MSELKISVTKREGHGRGPVRRLRAQGNLPAVVYGEDGNADSLQMAERDFLLLMRSLSGKRKIVTLDYEGQTIPVIIRDFQRNPISDRFEHVDFMKVYEGRKFRVSVPITTVGEAFGVKNEKGVLNKMVRSLEVECTSDCIPEEIKIDISALKKGEGIQIGKLTPPEGCRFTGRSDVVVVIVTK